MNLVLVHGILGQARFGPVRYFNGVADHLAQTFPGARILTTSALPLGTVAARAKAVAEQIDTARREGALDPREPIHLIAHSMGGLDARWLVATERSLAKHVRSVICIATPHHGSLVASIVDRVNPLQRLPRLLGLKSDVLDELKANLNAVHDLSEPAAAQLEKDCPDRPGVRYINVAAVGRGGVFTTSAFFQPTFLFLASRVGRNDGMVPYRSACRGKARPDVVWRCDHADTIGHDLDGPGVATFPRFRHLRAWADLVRRFVVQ